MMETLEEIYAGENFLVTVPMLKADGSALNRADCFSIAAKIYIDQAELASYVFGTNNELFAGTAANEIKVEGKTALALVPGTVKLKITIVVNDTDYPVEVKKTDIRYFSLFKVVEA